MRALSSEKGFDRVSAGYPTAEARLRNRFIRRWRLGVVGVLLTVGLSLGAGTVIGASYSAEAYILLTPPPTSAAGAVPNPYLALNGLLPFTDVVARALNSDTALTQARQAGLSGAYTVARDLTSNGPLLDVVTTASSGAAALKDLSVVVKMASPELTRLQAGQSLRRTQLVTPRVVSQDTVATASHKSQIRAAVVAAVIGLVLTALAVCVVDILLLRSRDRRRDGVSRTDEAAAPADADSADEARARATPAPPGTGRSRPTPGAGKGDLVHDGDVSAVDEVGGVPATDDLPATDEVGGVPRTNGVPKDSGVPGKRAAPGTNGAPSESGVPGKPGAPGKRGAPGKTTLARPDRGKTTPAPAGTPARTGSFPTKTGRQGRNRPTTSKAESVARASR